MKQPPDFDPYELLGVDASADAATIDRAYKARIRFVHPDIVSPKVSTTKPMVPSTSSKR